MKDFGRWFNESTAPKPEEPQETIGIDVNAAGQPLTGKSLHTVMPVDLKRHLRRLRLWHWNRYEMLQQMRRTGNTDPTLERHAKHHMHFVQMLNDFFAPTDSVHRDVKAWNGHQCDGKHAGPSCLDPACWHD